MSELQTFLQSRGIAVIPPTHMGDLRIRTIIADSSNLALKYQTKHPIRWEFAKNNLLQGIVFVCWTVLASTIVLKRWDLSGYAILVTLGLFLLAFFNNKKVCAEVLVRNWQRRVVTFPIENPALREFIQQISCCAEEHCYTQFYLFEEEYHPGSRQCLLLVSDPRDSPPKRFCIYIYEAS